MVLGAGPISSEPNVTSDVELILGLNIFESSIIWDGHSCTQLETNCEEDVISRRTHGSAVSGL